MPDLASLRPGDPERVREYQLTARLGEGGQGTVFLGVSPTGARVAVKLLRADLAQDEEALERFVREVSTTQRVAPFCTAAVIDTGVDQHRPYIVSEYIDGPTLDAVVAGEGPREGSALHRLAIGTVTALVAIHQAGIVHRDFKPSNVLLAPDGPRVIDFGIAKALDRTSTLTAMAIGTPSYMTPEQLAGETAGSPADMFAWGCTMVFAATGQPPFGTDSLPAIFNRIMNMEPDLRAITDPALRDLVGQCLSKDAALRPTAGEALLRLLGHAGGAPGVPAPTAPRGILAEGSAAAAQQTGPGSGGQAPAQHPGAGQGGHPWQTGPDGYPQTGPGRAHPHQTGPGGYPQQGPGNPHPLQTGPGGHPQAGPGYPQRQTGPDGYPQTGPGGYPQQAHHQQGPGYPQQADGYLRGGPDGYPQQAAPQPYGSPATYPSRGASPYPGQGPEPRSGRKVWVAVGAGLAVTLVAAVGITLALRGTTPDPIVSTHAGSTYPPATSRPGDSTPQAGDPTATPTSAVSVPPQATRTIKLPGSSITLHESEDDPIKLSAYSLDWDKNLYVRAPGGSFAKNGKYFQYTTNASGTHALATDKVYDKNNYAVVSVVDRRSGSVSKIKITKAPVYPTLPQWSPDGRRGLVTLYEAVGDTSKEYGYAVIDIARKKAAIVRVKEKDAGTWSYFWRGDGRAVGTWALAGKTQRIRFYDLQGTVLQTLLDVGTPVTVEGDDISPSGTLLMTYCKGTEREICIWSTAADAEARVRIPFATKRLIGWYDDQHIAGWRRKGTGYEAVVIDFRGQVKRVLATSTDAKEYEKQFMRFTREG
ncbi:serine/threonine protein kinase [Streptosporangium roseum]|uniref:non-specific serine/threonine protein kinase n=1 Tax=Streptosporangium roseum (strain ATCC 12428 / DSM 43021 / JCM 3005 / KCTC 9067 / NCIMB 10171 / NRRL 2505 / NI 9100) TaxID=479432 RepID=D2B4U2_STRRD|nr:serine/threonine-protein kinase [Streptosporangium roseum]ACZ85628.1 Serine/threonine protein kinase-like protein [Streptosporangium roseum DSM 43021]